MIRIAIVDDHNMVRQGLAVFLKAFEDMLLLWEVASAEEALRLCQQERPDVILMDMIMPGMTGIEATQQLRTQFPQTQVIALTSFNEKKELVQQALQAGAIGYLYKDVSIDDLASAIRAAAQGKPVLAPDATRALIQASTATPAPTFNLSERELEVLALMVAGLNNREIAEELVVSVSTAKFHVSSILSKMGASSRTEAAAMAVQHQLVK